MRKLRDLLYAIDRQKIALDSVLDALSRPITVELIGDPRYKELIDANALLAEYRNDIHSTQDWEEVAVYFANCQAETAHTFGSTKSLSRHETERHAAICSSLADSLEHRALINKRPSERQHVINRLRESAALCRKKLEAK